MPEAAGVGAKKRCEVHGEILKKDKVPIAYGYIRDYYPAARKELFPNSNKRALGGCVEKKAQNKVVSYCAKCRAAEEKYNRDFAEEYRRTGKVPEHGGWRKPAP